MQAQRKKTVQEVEVEVKPHLRWKNIYICSPTGNPFLALSVVLNLSKQAVGLVSARASMPVDSSWPVGGVLSLDRSKHCSHNDAMD